MQPPTVTVQETGKKRERERERESLYVGKIKTQQATKQQQRTASTSTKKQQQTANTATTKQQTNDKK